MEKPQAIKELEEKIKGATIEEICGWWGAIPTQVKARKGSSVIYVESCCACNSGFWHLYIYEEQQPQQ